MRLDFLLPPGWVAIPLHDEAARARAVDGLVARSGLDDGQGALLRRDLRRRLVSSVESAVAGGSSLLALSVGGPVPVPASVLVTYLPPRMGVDREDPWLTREGGRVDTATVAAGRVVRRVTRRDVDLDGADDLDLPTLLVDYWLDTPEGDQVQVSMSTPLVEHEEAMLGLFDAIIESASWSTPR